MRRIAVWLQLFLAVAMLATACPTMGEAVSAARGVNSQDIAWFHDLYEAHQQSARTGRPMLIVFGAPWCHYCREMEAKTLRDPKLVSYVAANFVPVHLDTEHDQRVAEILKVKPIPCTVVLSPGADLLGKIVGYEEVPQYYQQLEKSRQLYLKSLRRK
jgi:thioredoxin 1